MDVGVVFLAERAYRLLPNLQEAFSEIEELAGTGSAARRALLTRVTEVTLPLLCSYVSRWGEAGNQASQEGHCSSVTPQHANALLGHILSIIHAHLGTADSAWIKRLAGELVPLEKWITRLYSSEILMWHYFRRNKHKCSSSHLNFETKSKLHGKVHTSKI